MWKNTARDRELTKKEKFSVDGGRSKHSSIFSWIVGIAVEWEGNGIQNNEKRHDVKSGGERRGLQKRSATFLWEGKIRFGFNEQGGI